MMGLLNRFLFVIAFGTGWLVVKLYHLTCRIEHRGPLLKYLQSGKPFLMAWWHQDMLFNYSYLTSIVRKRRIGTLASRSQDGELAEYLLKKHYFYVFRGSSSSGGSTALKQLVDWVREERGVGVIVCDGPRPPARVAKSGIVALARETGLPVILVRSWARRQFIFRKSWPKLAFVYPFSRVIMLSDGPVTVSKNTARGDLDRYRLEVEKRLNRLAEQSEKHFV